MKKNQPPVKKTGLKQTEKVKARVGKADYTETEDCISGECWDLGGQRTFVQAFDISNLRVPSNRLEQWVAERLLTYSHADADWWTQFNGSKEIRPLIKSLRRKNWPIDDHYVKAPTFKLPGRQIKNWFIPSEFKIQIFKLMDAAGLFDGENKSKANKSKKVKTK